MRSLHRRCGSSTGRAGRGVALLVAALAAGVLAAAASPAPTADPGRAAAAVSTDAKLEVRPWGEGTLTIDPPGVDAQGAPASPTCDRATLNDFAPALCERYYARGTVVTVQPSPRLGGAFLGWSDHACSGTAACRLTLEAAETSLLGRFSPVKLGVRMRGEGSGNVTSDPPGLVCTLEEGECLSPFPVGQPAALVAAASFPFVGWRFGCTPLDPRRCAVSFTHDPHWVGVAVGTDVEVGRPATISVRFAVSRSGQGTVRGREFDCGSQCERRYPFGEREELLARPAQGWRFTRWQGECEREQPCRVLVGPVTSVQAVFTQNLAPVLHRVSITGRGAGRRVVVRLSVRKRAQARIVIRRVGRPRAVLDRRLPLRAGANALTVAVPRGAAAGQYRITIAVADGEGGGRTYTVLRRIGR